MYNPYFLLVFAPPKNSVNPTKKKTVQELRGLLLINTLTKKYSQTLFTFFPMICSHIRREEELTEFNFWWTLRHT